MYAFLNGRLRAAGTAATDRTDGPVRRRRGLLRVATVAALGAVPALALAAPAYAVTGVAKVGGAIVANSSANEVNRVTINRVGGNFLISDSVDTMAAGAGCVLVNAHLVRCSAAGVNLLRINTGDRNDRITNNTGTRSDQNGGTGSDTLVGGTVGDVLTGGSGDDTLSGRGGNDTANALAVRDGRDRFDGGAGTDTTNYAARNLLAVNVSLDGIANDGSAPEFDNNLANVENAIGGSRNDTLTGNGAGNNLQGRAGSDRLTGLGGNDTLNGGLANDTMVGGPGTDTLVGGAGNDAAVALSVRDGADRFFGGPGVDTTTYAARTTLAVNVSLDNVANDGSAPEFDTNRTDVENVIGGRRGDTLTGNASNNRMAGQNGNDTIRGGGGADSITGGADADRMFGESGNDTLNGLDGVNANDLLNGGVNTDTCFADPGDAKVSCELP